ILHYYFSVLRPQPSHTLLPYTTLFRSSAAVGKRDTLRCEHAIRHLHHQSRACPVSRFPFPGRSVAHLEADRIGARHVSRPLDARDRKSTRLNSSHDQNSYAVFCLKKKI